MSVAVKVEILKAVRLHPTGIKELVRKLNHRPETVISLVEEMEEQGLLERKVEKRSTRGRPRCLIRPTVLGEDYVSMYNALESKPLRSRRPDLARAVRDAEYVRRLVARGLSPFHLLLELNSFVAADNGDAT